MHMQSVHAPIELGLRGSRVAPVWFVIGAWIMVTCCTCPLAIDR